MLDGYHLLHFMKQGYDFNKALTTIKEIFSIKAMQEKDFIDQLPYIDKLQNFLKNRLEEEFLLACALGNDEAVKAFITDGVNVHCEDLKGRNAAHYIAMRRGELGKGLLLDIYQRHYEIPPTNADIAACFEGRKVIIDRLLDLEVSFTKANSAGNTALQLIASQKTAAKTNEEAKDFVHFIEIELKIQKHAKQPSKISGAEAASTTPTFSMLSGDTLKEKIPRQENTLKL